MFPLVSLWNIYNNVILYSCFSDYKYIKNLYTNHITIFYVHDLNWHETSTGYYDTLEALETADVLICKSEEDSKKIKEYSGVTPLILSDINLEEIINGFYNSSNG